MSNWHPNSNKHKARHGGYRAKPSRKEVKALMGMYAAIATETKVSPVKKQKGVQLKINFP